MESRHNVRVHVLIHLDNESFGGSERTVEPLLHQLVDKAKFTICHRSAKNFSLPDAWLNSADICTRPLRLGWFPGFRSRASGRLTLLSVLQGLSGFIRYLLSLPGDFVRIWTAVKVTNPDLIHVVMGGFPGARSSRLFVFVAKRVNRLPVIMSLHNQPSNAGGPVQSLERVFDRIALGAPNLITFASEQSVRSMRQYAPDLQTHLRVMLNTNPDEEATEITYLKNANREPKYEFVLVARLEESKGIDVFLQALSMIKRGFQQKWETQPRGLIVGSGRLEEDLQVLCSSLGLDGQVTFRAASPKYFEDLAQGRVCVQPSVRAEDSPLSTLAAMQLGLPLVVSDVGGLRAQVAKSNGVVVRPNEPEMLAHALEYTLLNPEGTTNMGDRSRDFYWSAFSNRMYGRAWESTYMAEVD